MLPTKGVAHLLRFTKEKKNFNRLYIYLSSLPGFSLQGWKLDGLVFGLGGPAHNVYCSLGSTPDVWNNCAPAMLQTR